MRAGVRAVWLVGLGAPVLTVGLLWPSELLSIVGGALVLAGLVSHLTSLAQVIHHRRRGLELLADRVHQIAGDAWQDSVGDSVTVEWIWPRADTTIAGRAR